MKRYLIVLVTLLLILTVGHGQTNVFQPFPKDSVVWVYHTSSPQGNDYDLFIQLLGDTTINAISYKKEIHRYSYSPPGWTYDGGIRQDIPNEKTYKVDYYGVEHDVSVSQHLIIGDTLPVFSYGLPLPYDSLIINSIDSVQVGTKFHKRYNSYQPTDGNYIVGVGMAGIIHSNPAQMIGLSCFSVDNINQYGSAPPCQLVSINEFVISENKIFISPNPFSVQTTLRSDIFLKNATLTVTNYIGQAVKQIKYISGQAVILQRDNLPSGLYFFRLVQDNKVVATDKLIITDN